MKQLQLGKISWAELADWFGIKLPTLKGTKEKKLKLLSGYCSFHIEQIGKRKTIVVIDKIYEPIYSKTLDRVKEIFPQYQNEGGTGLDTAARIGRSMSRKDQVLIKTGVKESTIINYTGIAMRQFYGKLYLPFSQGTKGYREPTWCRRGKDGYYYVLNEEQLKLLDEAKKRADLCIEKNQLKILNGYYKDKKEFDSLTAEEKAKILDVVLSETKEEKYDNFLSIATKLLGFTPVIASKCIDMIWMEASEEEAEAALANGAVIMNEEEK